MEIDQFKNEAIQVSASLAEIHTAVEVIEYFEELARENSDVMEESWGQDSSGREIQSYTMGTGDFTFLLYGFPDPGEAVGGTSLICFSKLLLDKNSFFSRLPIRLVIVPCLNFVDQPDEGRSHARLQKTSDQEVDWCVSNPRKETTAILNVAEKYQPDLTFPLHDEWHSKKYVRPYVGVDREIGENLVSDIKQLFASENMEMNPEYSHERMGQGIFQMPSIGEEYLNCTYSRFAKTGQVFICEVPFREDLSASKLVSIQLRTGLLFLLSALENRKK